jgi:hypothetical protein
LTIIAEIVEGLMSEPNDSVLPIGVGLVSVDGRLQLTPDFVKLLVSARECYDWPSGTGARESQQVIVQLEHEIAEYMCCLDTIGAHKVVCLVSEWAGNNAKAHTAIVNANDLDKAVMLSSLRLLGDRSKLDAGLDCLAGLPGISLVIASKIHRFCYPASGASVDRHASYFFNSIPIIPDQGTNGMKGTSFKREWSTGRHTTSRLATFTDSGYMRNRKEYVEMYLPLLANIAACLNAIGMGYTCAVAGAPQFWRPTDVEMAAYCWWASNGAR